MSRNVHSTGVFHRNQLTQPRGGHSLAQRRAIVRVLLVTPQASLRAAITDALTPRAEVDVCAGFPSARARLSERPYDLLVISVRLGAYNGLHLVHLARALQLPTRAVVFDLHSDIALASETQDAGAFFEHADRIAIAAPAYLGAALPSRDRRNPARYDCRTLPRGGRRAADEARLMAPAHP